MSQDLKDGTSPIGISGMEPPHRAHDSLSALADASTLPTRIDERIHRNLRQLRLDLMTEKRRTDALQEEVRGLSEQAHENCSQLRGDREPPFMTGRPTARKSTSYRSCWQSRALTLAFSFVKTALPTDALRTASF